MRILITGGSGLLGQYLNMELSKENEILTTYLTDPGNCKNCNSVQLDIRDKENVINLFKNFKPEIVVHLAAISTPMPVPSLSSKKIYDINVNSTSTLAELCNNYSAKLIFISTDLVYAGYRGSMLKEDSKLIPISLYAETKLMGELKIQEISSNYIILRTSFLYGFGIENKKNHFDQMYNNLKNGKQVKLFYDQYRTALSLPEAVRIINQLTKLDIKNEIINFGGNERVNRVEMGELLCEIAGFDKSQIRKISMKEIPDYQAVEDVSLNTDKLQSLGIRQKSVKESIKKIIIN